MTSLTTFLNCAAEFLTSRPAGVGVGDENTYCSRLDFQAFSDEHADLSSSQRPNPLESVVLASANNFPDVPPGAASDSNYALSALTPQTFYQQPSPMVVQASLKKVQFPTRSPPRTTPFILILNPLNTSISTLAVEVSPPCVLATGAQRATTGTVYTAAAGRESPGGIFSL
ncbi:hypothetical protein K503DRAFT_867810 [Rhizopogon vinicolor AM-OR11-026]|uniref:Uncharacterized protein n=1 Tax=Rhizopogon vinicolor AM-OR11-026 TaxID=1314800 RepID=A0A1B7MU65_9AGAM|nr:hypothetical protein K503DRAFT_867810 [Rhizopogon vinicolor AM-OR11-026]